MTVWCLIVMVFTSPGYIPLNYSYDIDKMSEIDRKIYEHLKKELNTTYYQANEYFDEAIVRGSVTAGPSNHESIRNNFLCSSKDNQNHFSLKKLREKQTSQVNLTGN